MSESSDGIVEARNTLAAARAEGLIAPADHAAADEALVRLGEMAADIEALGAGAEVRVSISITKPGS